MRTSSELRRAFATLMARSGKPITRITPASRRGAPEEIYRLPDGATVRLRTSRVADRIVIRVDKVEAAKGADGRLPFEGREDFLGAAYLTDNDTVVGYLIPSAEAAKVMREGHRRWEQADPDHSRTNALRMIDFANESGFHDPELASKWAPYHLGEIRLQDVNNDERAQAIADARRMVAAAHKVSEDAVHISISY
jgi:hypothetical protein